jgi:hypothetical protein
MIRVIALTAVAGLAVVGAAATAPLSPARAQTQPQASPPRPAARNSRPRNAGGRRSASPA